MGGILDKQDIPFLPATELSGLIKSRTVSPVEAVESYLERIEGLNSKLYAYLTVCPDRALEAAREAERSIIRGDYLGPMHGVPVAVKDQLSTQGIRTTGGSLIYKDHVPTEDATVVTRLYAAGAILLGKLNMTEFASSGLSHMFDTVRNPWDMERYTGMSSSGSGAATAAFLCATSLGEDTGGSIRLPAAWCGIVGLRPSWGRVSRYGLMPGCWSMDTVGPLSRTVEDCAVTLQAIAGHDPRDPYTWDVPVPDYGASLDGDIAGVKVGVVKEILYSGEVDPEVRDAVVKASAVLEELGASVKEVSVPLSPHALSISAGLRIEAPMTHWELLKHRARELARNNRISYLVGSILPAQAYYKAQKLRELLRRQVLDALKETDVLLTPTTGTAAQRIVPDPAVHTEGTAKRLSWVLTTAFSLANTPALSICCGFTSEDLPIGLQIAGRPFDETTVLKTAHAYEQSTTWHRRRPPI